MAGSLLVQSLLRFRDPKLIVSSILRMTTDDIIKVSCDPSGSHVTEAFMESSSVPVKRKYRLLERIKPGLVALCTDKHGSRAMDAVWRNCDIDKKEVLASDLQAHEEELTGSFYGRIVLRNCNLSHYKRKQAAWKDQERGVARRQEMFQDILDSEGQEKLPEGGVKVRAHKRQREGQDTHLPQRMGQEKLSKSTRVRAGKRKDESDDGNPAQENLSRSDSSTRLRAGKRQREARDGPASKRKIPLFDESD